MLKDKPITNQSDDILGRTRFAEKISSMILSYIEAHSEDKEGLVIGLEGSWGSGKTSLIRLIQDCLRKVNHPNMGIRKFNSWLAADQDTLILDFFKIMEKEAFENTNFFENCKIKCNKF